MWTSCHPGPGLSRRIVLWLSEVRLGPLSYSSFSNFMLMLALFTL